MLTRLRSAAWHPRTVAFTVFVAAVYAATLGIVHSAAFAGRPDLLGPAVAADLTLVVPLAYWALVVHRGAAAIRSLLPAVALSVLGAKLVLPTSHQRFVGLLRYATMPLECVVIGYGVWSARRTLGCAGAGDAPPERDAAESFEHRFLAALGDRAAARILAAEVATLYYAFLAREGTPTAREHAVVFSQARARSAALAWGFGLTVCVEAVVLHLWLVRTHPVAAWALTALSAYSVVWLVGHHRATGLRPVVVAGGAVALRAGLRLTARVPLAAVERVDEVSWRTAPPPAPDYLDATRPRGPNVVLTLQRPTGVTGPLGLRRTITRVGLRLDDPAGFAAAVRRGCAESSTA